MNGSPKKEMSSQMRTLLASVLSIAVIMLWSFFFKPPAPPPQQNSPTASATQTPTNVPAPGAPVPAAALPLQAGPSSQKQKTSASPFSVKPVAEKQARGVVVENGLYHVEFSNLGAVIKSWKLKKYMDDAKPPRTLDLVHPEAALQVGAWPFSLVLNDPQDEAAVNNGLYVVTPASAQLDSPAELDFAWSDGRLEATKHFKFDHSYVVQIETSVKLNGNPIVHGIAWRGGFGDNTIYNPAAHVQIIYGSGGKLQTLPDKKLTERDKLASGFWTTGNDYAGIEDQHFAAVFLPPPSAPGILSARYWVAQRDVQVDSKPAKEPVVEVAVGSATSGSILLRAYIGPKDYDDLKHMNPPLNALVQFGWMEIIADPLFHLLKWIHKYIPNYGWAIVILTLAINMVLYPLKVKSYRTSQRMQKVGPEIRQIQDRYKKYSMRDPRKAEMNKEIMAVYSREGINPAGGCLPMFLQMPIWFALYRMLGTTIELRHAPWFGWIHDLSAPDPYRILPVIMGVSMYVMQRMTPMPATDPAQQSMMKIMPIMFAGMFIVFPVSSGLVVYILTSNLVGIAQQLHLNRHQPATVSSQIQRGMKK